MASGGIYEIRNRINGNCYIGSTMNLQHRWLEHLSALRHSVHCNRHLQAAFRKYGESAFTFVTLEFVEKASQLIPREQHYLDTLNPKYNIARTAGSRLGCRHTNETKQKLSKANMGKRNPNYGKPRSEETKRKMSEAWTLERRLARSEAQSGEQSPSYGKSPSLETRRKISEALLGRPLSKEHKRKIGEASRKRIWTEASRLKLSKAFTGRLFSKEHRRKLSDANKGKHHSAETRRKMSEAQRARWRRVHAMQNQ